MRPPVDLTAALASFDALWSPRVVERVNDYDVRVAHVRGEHVWHVHDDTDEFFLVLSGSFDVAQRVADGTEDVARLAAGQVHVVPRGVEHRPSSVDGATILMFEPTGTPTTGDRHEGSTDHVDVTTGHELG